MISPLDIRQHTFKKSLRGYDPDEVQAYLTSLANEVQGLLQQQADLKMELERAKAAIARYQETEAMLHKTLQQAEMSSKAVVDNAKREAELILHEADQRANELLQKAYDERSRLDSELADLNSRRNDVLHQLERFLLSQVDQLASFKANDGLRLPRAEPPTKRPPRATTAQPLPSDPPTFNSPAPEAPTPTPRTPAPPPEPEPNILTQKPKSFFDEALTPAPRTGLEDLVDEL